MGGRGEDSVGVGVGVGVGPRFVSSGEESVLRWSQ